MWTIYDNNLRKSNFFLTFINLFVMLFQMAGWRSLVSRWVHIPEVACPNHAPATMYENEKAQRANLYQQPEWDVKVYLSPNNEEPFHASMPYVGEKEQIISDIMDDGVHVSNSWYPPKYVDKVVFSQKRLKGTMMSKSPPVKELSLDDLATDYAYNRPDQGIPF